MIYFGSILNRQKTNDSFHRAIGPVLLVAQCFGLMPITAILNPNHAYIRFKWLSIRTTLAIINVMTGFFLGVVALRSILLEGINLRNIVGVIFFTCCTTSIMLFIRLAIRWHQIIQKWYTSEKSFLNDQLYSSNQPSLAIQIRFISGVVFLIAIVEHVLYNTSNWYNMYVYTKTCNVTIDDWWHYFFSNHFVSIFSVLPYHFIITLYLEYSNFALTVSWNYMDLFIMLISIGISTRFKQVNHRLKIMYDQILPDKYWEQLRCDYTQLCDLVDYIDNHLAAIILLSCTNNLYFICFQLLNIFNPLPHTINKVYFWFSLLYLIGRTISVYLCAAAIHDTSKLPLETIRNIPNTVWCGELNRFAEQVRSDLIALSGSNFFYMTRKLLFGVAGTVVTYELVLLQFDRYNSRVDYQNSTNSAMCADKY